MKILLWKYLFNKLYIVGYTDNLCRNPDGDFIWLKIKNQKIII